MIMGQNMRGLKKNFLDQLGHWWKRDNLDNIYGINNNSELQVSAIYAKKREMPVFDAGMKNRFKPKKKVRKKSKPIDLTHK